MTMRGAKNARRSARALTDPSTMVDREEEMP
jgi:hypothetical protein